MKMRLIRSSEGLDTVAEELTFTASILESEEHGKEYAPAVREEIGKVDKVRSGQIEASREEVAAHAAVASADTRLDVWITAFDRTLKDVVQGDTKAPLYRRYFSAAPWTFVRMALEAEMARVRGWVDSLASEPNQKLKDMGAQLATLITQGEAALERRRKAENARDDHRVRSITSIIEEINTRRAALYGQLASKAAEAGLPLDWPSHFFRRTSHIKEATPAASADPKPDPTTKPAA
jgi:hypothetical protein